MPLDTLTLTDPTTGASARILLGLGFNCYSFQTVRKGGSVEWLWSHPEFPSGDQRPSHSGIPILFPFAGRIEGTTLHDEGNRYTLQEGDGQGNAIHGFVLDRPWRIVDVNATEVTGQFQASVDDRSLLEQWPADFCITVTYALDADALACHIRIDNPDQSSLPFGLGTHPYFRIPKEAGGRGDNCLVTVPAAGYWELADLVPTGRRSAIDPQSKLDLRDGARYADCQLDAVLTDLAYPEGRCVTSLRDPGGGWEVRQTFAEVFAHCVVYTPPHREAVCMEPYTCVPNAAALEAQGIATGLRRLPPGETFETTIRIEVRSSA